jgi:FkbM family methyltransferase
MKVHAYLLDWHRSLSPAFHEIFINHLQGHAEVREVAWDGKSIMPEWLEPGPEDVFAFCQKRPPAQVFASRPDAKVIWLPMWNNVQRMTASDWASIPKTIRILAYTPLISERSIAAGLPTLLVRYAPDPGRFPETVWSEGRILYYWNRVGLVRKDTLIRLCKELQIRKLLFRPFLDPGIPQELGYDVTTREAGFEVETVPFFDSPAEANAFTSRANVVIAPRPSEGVGLAFLEAMAAGKAVLSVNRPTMSEYIEHGRTGILLKAKKIWWSNGTPMLSTRVSGRQDWSAVKGADLEAIGRNARKAMSDCQRVWQDDVVAIRKFVLDWSRVRRAQAPSPPQFTELEIAELHRLSTNAMSVPRFAPFFVKRLRALREQLHPRYKKDLRVIKLRTGLNLQVNLGDHMGCDFYYGIFSEQQDFDLFMAAVKPGACVIDVGANVGIYAITAAQRAGADGRVFAFEPGMAARELLVGNVARNRLTRSVKILGACVGDYDGTIEFAEAADSAMSGIQDTQRGGSVHLLQSPITTLDTAMAREGIGRVDAIKIDVEGAEAMVLRGAMQVLERSDPVVMLEISAKNAAEQVLTALQAVLLQLEASGYRMLRLLPGSCELKEFDRTDDVFQQSRAVISGNYFMAKPDTGRFAELRRLFTELEPIIRRPNRVFPGRPRSRLNFLSRDRHILWAERQKAEIALELIAELSRAKDHQ